MIAIRLNGLHWAQVSLFLVGWFSTSYVTSFMSQFGSLTSHVDSLPPSRFRLSSAQWGLGFVCPRLMLANALGKFPNLFCCFPNVLGRFPHTWYVVSLTTQVGLLYTEISSPITSASSLMSKSSGWSTKRWCAWYVESTLWTGLRKLTNERVYTLYSNPVQSQP